MKKLLFLLPILVLSCAKQPTHPPVGGILSEKDMKTSQNRAKSLNDLERSQIQDWINGQDVNYYPTALGYWSSIENLESNTKRLDGTPISYEYQIYDFDKVKLTDAPIERQNVFIGKFEELKAVENAVRYLKAGEEATLLIPSALAYGTYGDNDKISNDMPLIIELKVLN